jgi:hypothetical protein
MLPASVAQQQELIWRQEQESRAKRHVSKNALHRRAVASIYCIAEKRSSRKLGHRERANPLSRTAALFILKDE